MHPGYLSMSLKAWLYSNVIKLLNNCFESGSKYPDAAQNKTCQISYEFSVANLGHVRPLAYVLHRLLWLLCQSQRRTSQIEKKETYSRVPEH